MKDVIIGTAGHVDHGKTRLIKALTGIDTDRLAEEKKRGITIDLGFAHIDFDDELRAGIIDVPGHEKFIKNMLAGAGGIDIGMLVVAANEGIMPQTIEHLGILSMLGIMEGIIVITKSDLVEDEWYELIKEDVTLAVKGTFLEGKPIVRVSTVSGEGLTELKALLHALVAGTAGKDHKIPFRQHIDRVFSVEGFGTIATGTLIEGLLSVGETVEILPSQKTAKVRNIQVYGTDVKTAFAGQRAAVNLSGLKRSEIRRGDTLAKLGSIKCSLLLDTRLCVLPSSCHGIKNGSCLHFYHGSHVMLCKVQLLDREELQHGESCYAQIRLTEPIAVKNGDRFILRFYSPLETIGGGIVLDACPPRRKRFDASVISALEIRESGTGAERITQVLERYRTTLPDRSALMSEMTLCEHDFNEEFSSIIARGGAVEILPGRYIAISVLDTLWRDCELLLRDYHAENPLHKGMKIAELRQKLFKKTDAAVAGAILSEFANKALLYISTDRVALPGFEVKFTKRQSAISAKLLELYRKAGFEPPPTVEVLSDFNIHEQADAREVFESLVKGGELILLTPDIVLTAETFGNAMDVVQCEFEKKEALTLAEFRDAIGSSRKYVQAFLEYLDRIKVLKRVGDVRVFIKDT